MGETEILDQSRAKESFILRTLDSHSLFKKSPRLFLGLTCLLLFTAQSVSGQDACPPPPNYVENPLSTPSITAAEVAANPTAGNLKMFALAARDYLFSVGYVDQLQLTHALCFLRQEGGDWHSGGIFPIALRVNTDNIMDQDGLTNPGWAFQRMAMRKFWSIDFMRVFRVYHL